MGKILSYTFYTLQVLAIFTSFIFSLRLIKNEKIPKYMKGFYWYTVVGVLVLIPSLFYAYFYIGNKLASITNNLSLIFHYSFLSIFILKILPKNKGAIYLKIIFLLFLILIIYFLVTRDISRQINQVFSISNIGLTIFCIVYYYQLFNTVPILDLRNEPSFWIITGIFFAMSLNVPAMAAIDYLHNKIAAVNYVLLYNILCFSYMVMHLFFIKAFICTLRMPKA